MSDTELQLNTFLLGTVVAMCIVAGLFFLRFWRRTRDRLFLMFAIAFWMLSLNWAALVFVNELNEFRTAFYVVRMLAFVLILLAVFDKNRKAKTPA
jgi:Ca2+/Na+ antiporter